jgi:2'-5' RNA ligase
MRLFVAVDIDQAARASIAGEQQRLRAVAEGGSALRWVKSDQLHMTLVFLGEIEEVRAAAVIAAYDAPAAVAPFDLVFQGVGVFPARGAPRALWIGIGEGETQLSGLQRLLAARALELGVALDSRPFRPHLTLGRWKESRSSDRHRLVDQGRGGAIARVQVTCATLYRSQLSSSGPAYTPLAHVTLTAPR